MREAYVTMAKSRCRVQDDMEKNEPRCKQVGGKGNRRTETKGDKYVDAGWRQKMGKRER